MMQLPGFLLFIDEAGDDGTDTVRPIDENGSSEFFILAGVLIRVHRRNELLDSINAAKRLAQVRPEQELHFRDVAAEAQISVVRELARFNAGLVAVVSNKRNMRQYRNKRVEAKNMEIVRDGKEQPQRYNWFYNHLFRYLLETASAECARYSVAAFGRNLPIQVIFSHRKHFRYSQTKAYLHKLSIATRDASYFNNKHQIDWSVVNPSLIDSARSKSEPGLQFADCVASSIFKAVDEDRFGTVVPEFISELAPRFVRAPGKTEPLGYGFKLLPDGYNGPLSARQIEALSAIGFNPAMSSPGRFPRSMGRSPGNRW